MEDSGRDREDLELGSIRIFDDALTEDFCTNLIESFKVNLDRQETKDKFVQFNYSEVYEEEQTHKDLTDFIFTLREHYLKQINLPPNMFETSGVEKLRIRKYLNNEENVLINVDVRDKKSSIRALGFIFFLNDSERKVELFRQNLGITGKAGRVIVYPPTWEYPYRVSDKAEDDTYCLQSYIHYG